MARAPVENDDQSSGESSFGFDELFFSRTDDSGIIKYGNSVFQRVSVYSWDELMEKPHKIVRHPDMPRAVFWLLWRRIKQGKPIGAYVKNKAKDGRYYWVFALVTPVEGGYLSVRLRPSSHLFDVVKGAYAELVALERQKDLPPEDSAQILLDKLKDLGFDNYPSFMTQALGKELISRDRQLDNPQDTATLKFDELLKVTQSLLSEAQTIATAYENNAIVPTNFRILASQLGQDGTAISVISDNYSLLSRDMRNIIEGFISSAQGVVKAISTGYFLANTARVQREVLDFFRKEECDTNQHKSRDKEMALLSRQQSEYVTKAQAGLSDISIRCNGFRRTCLDLDRIATGLEVMRVVGKVECSRHEGVKDRVDDLLAKLENFQKTVTGALKELARMNAIIQQEADSLREQAEKAA